MWIKIVCIEYILWSILKIKSMSDVENTGKHRYNTFWGVQEIDRIIAVTGL